MLYRHLAAALVLGIFARGVEAQEIVYRMLTPDQLEKMLKGSRIEYKKLADKKANTFFYDYKSKNFNLRLYFLGGKQLMLDSLFAAMSLERVNEWNLGAKFTRAGLGKDDKGGSFTVIDSHLNLRGGVTQAAIKEFLNAFVADLEEFQSFVRASEPRKDVAKEEKTFQEIPPDLLERILEDLKIKYAKVPLPDGSIAFQYESKDSKIVLMNWGKDMMLEAKFPKLSLEKVNQYNLDRKFIRAVAYNNKKGEYTGLEANMSFLGGVTESIVRNFIAVFEEDVRECALYVKKASD
jgi:Putative bacterial sensory transduction regulator